MKILLSVCVTETDQPPLKLLQNAEEQIGGLDRHQLLAGLLEGQVNRFFILRGRQPSTHRIAHLLQEKELENRPN
jgi:hypothetical protein